MKMKKETILVLGHKGMLGNTVISYFQKFKNFNVMSISNSRFPEEDFINSVMNANADFIINCIGAIPQKSPESYNINYDLPKWLAENCKSSKIIHPGTDCEIDNSDYGLSKKKATELLLKEKSITNTKVIKTSVIGPELLTQDSLFSWFLSRKDNSIIYGYTQHFWSGITSLHWSKIAHRMIEDWENFDNLIIPDSDCISKYDLLVLLRRIFNKNIVIKKCNKISANKCLEGNYKIPDIEEQIKQLKMFIKNKKKDQI